jgi:hypothetical protein
VSVELVVTLCYVISSQPIASSIILLQAAFVGEILIVVIGRQEVGVKK